MKRIFIFIWFTISFFATCVMASCPKDIPQGTTIGKINFSTRRINSAVLRKKSPLKEGDIFLCTKYQQMQNKLHDMRIFKTLSFDTKFSDNSTVDIQVNADDYYYLFPIAFLSGGAKSAGAVSIIESNILKQGETIHLTSGASKDGALVNAGINIDNHLFNVQFENLNFDRRFYDNNWSSTFGIFSTTEDKPSKFGQPNWQNYNKYDRLKFTYGYKLQDFTFLIQPTYFYVRTNPNIDNGNHASITTGITYSKNFRPTTNMGALFGIGLSDKSQVLKPLPQNIFSYQSKLFYTKGSSWMGSDYNLDKISFQTTAQLELKNRNAFLAYVHLVDVFSASFSEESNSLDLIGMLGKYSRQRLADKGIGAGIAFSYFLVRNNWGLLSLQPFYESALVRWSNHTYQQSGIGANLTYKLWRFPFPIGINYTHNLNDGSDQVGFTAGMSF